ncbi:MAG: molybdopterin/thiamine biosynthesis adenylyltransferase/rhodanese-related sulfurtransferase [Saprospiraceae bacterium]|jgi:molybdopterin/thiamine biosynthesis adenylyltransferase/rhodanese-related sulfurtransferase
MSLSTEEQIRYSRHFNLPNFGVKAQEKLKNAKVLVVGAGGLGSPLLLYLAAAGIGHIGIIDDDIIDLSNLQRQVLYSEEQIGQPKTSTAAQRIHALNPNVGIITYEGRLTTENALEIIKDYDVVADGTDNFPTRYLVNDACVILNVINVYASIYQYEGQVSVFNYPLVEGTRGPHYRDLFPTPPEPGLVPDCATGGVLGVMAGIVGSYQALEVIKCIVGIGQPLIGKLLIFDALSSSSRTLKFKKTYTAEISELINYEDFCGVGTKNNKQEMSAIREITVHDLQEWKESGKDFQLIDVREQHEIEFATIGGEHIVLSDLLARQAEVEDEKEVVIMCRSGQRSAAAVNALQQQGFDNLYNLKGGITAWSKEIDPSIPTY